MTVQSIDLATLSREDLDVVVDALRIADAHYRALAETMSRTHAHAFAEQFEQQAREASELQLKMEAAR